MLLIDDPINNYISQAGTSELQLFWNKEFCSVHDLILATPLRNEDSDLAASDSEAGNGL
jgi:hypothetical protein